MEFNNIDFSFDALESMQLNDSCCGKEIDYDPDFLELENLVAAKNDQQYGDTIIPASPIDWSKAFTKGCELLEKSKDYRLCSIITRALTHKYGIKGTLKGIETIQALTINAWNQAYPRIVFDDETDFLPRANAIAELNSPFGLVGDLRTTHINLGAAGKITIGKIEKILSARADIHENFSRDQLLKILHDEVRNKNEDLTAIKTLSLSILNLELQLANLLDNEHSPDFNQLKSLLHNIYPINNSLAEQEGAESTPLVSSMPLPNETIHKDFNPISIVTRTDAIELLDKICDFLAYNDPANPAPLLIKRARNMIGQDFFTILSQLAPDAVTQAEQVTGPQF